MRNLLEVEIRAKRATVTESISDGPNTLPDVVELSECMMGGYESYSQQSFEDRIRQAVAMIKQAIMDEAHKGIGDDGRVAKPTKDYSSGPWFAAESLLAKSVFVDQFKPLVDEVRAEIDKFYE